MEVIALYPVLSGSMRHIVTVQDVAALFPHRKKSTHYSLLASIRDATERRVVTVADLVNFTGIDEATIRQAMKEAR